MGVIFSWIQVIHIPYKVGIFEVGHYWRDSLIAILFFNFKISWYSNVKHKNKYDVDDDHVKATYKINTPTLELAKWDRVTLIYGWWLEPSLMDKARDIECYYIHTNHWDECKALL